MQLTETKSEQSSIAMHVSRYMKRLAREILEEDPDALKVCNDNPSEEFAFDLSPPVQIGTVFESTPFEATDDFGHPVTIVPVDRTGVTVFLNFAQNALRLDFPDAVAVDPFVRRICHLIRTVVCHPGSAYQTFIPSDEILRLQISRLFWDASLGAWTLHWVEEPQCPLAICLWRDGLMRLRDSIQSCISGSLSLDDTLYACVRVLDGDYPLMAREEWGGLTQLVYDSSDEDDYLNSSQRKRHTRKVFRSALPLIEDRLAQLPPDETND
jgi:hypothetical protein